MKSIKEKQLLVKWSRAMGTEIDPALVEEVERYEQIQKEIVESVRSNTIKDLAEAAVVAEQFVEKINITYPKPPTLDEVLTVLKEESDELVQAQAEKTPTGPEPKTLADLAAEHITKEVKLEEKTYQQPDVDLPGRTLNDIRKKIKFLEDWVSKISLTGPGGGAGDVINLDMPTKLVTGDYTITRRDYYVGVNCDVKCYITLPDPSTIVNGREVIIKDESGHAQLTPIKVIGVVDNDPNGFEIRINNGSVTLIYRDGWRIV
jgi:hypothetical protein